MHYFTISEYKRFSGISRPTIYKFVKAGHLDFQPTEEGTIIIKIHDTDYQDVKGKVS